MLGVLLVIVTIALSSSGEVEIFDIKSGTTDFGLEDGHQQRFAVAPSNRWYVSYVDADGDFNVSWSDNNGTVWDNVTLQSDGWKGETYMAIQGVYCWVNNTTCVIIRTEGADNVHDVYLFYLWGQNDASDPAAWNYTSVRGGAFTYRYVDARFNRSGVLYIFGQYSTDLVYRYEWNVSTGEFNSIASNWGTYSSPKPRVQVDHNDDVFILYDYLSKTWCVDVDKTVSMSVNHQVGGLGVGAFFITEDNTKVFTAFRQYLSTNYKRVYYESVVNTSFAAMTFGDDTNDWETARSPTGNVYGNVVSLIMLRQETGSDEYVRYRAAYDAIIATWEGSETVLWTTPTDDDLSNSACGANSVWPKINDISVSIPTSGTVCWWVFQDEVGADDDFYDILYWDNIEFPWWDWPSNFPPEFSSESPTNGTTGVALQPWCHVTIEDPDGDDFNVTWYENSTGSWVQRQQNLTASNGTFWWRFTQASSYSTTYYWKLVANDTNSNENTTIYHFTTLGNTPPVGSSPFPSNGSSGIIRTPTCRITVLDADSDLMDIYWLENTTGSWVERHVDSSVSDGTFSFQFTQFSVYSTTYYWRINLTDGTDNVTYIFHFTTMDNQAPSVVFPSPGNGSTSLASPTTSITVGDLDPMDVDWLEWTGGTWVLRQRSTSISSGVYTWVFSGATEDDETYYWAVNATDGSLNTTKVYHFTVDAIAPTEDDEGFNLETLDYSMFIGLMFLIIVVMIAGLGAIVKYTRDDV